MATAVNPNINPQPVVSTTKASGNHKIHTIVLLAITALSAVAATACYSMAMPFIATASAAGTSAIFAIITIASLFIRTKSIKQQAPLRSNSNNTDRSSASTPTEQRPASTESAKASTPSSAPQSRNHHKKNSLAPQQPLPIKRPETPATIAASAQTPAETRTSSPKAPSSDAQSGSFGLWALFSPTRA